MVDSASVVHYTALALKHNMSETMQSFKDILDEERKRLEDEYANVDPIAEQQHWDRHFAKAAKEKALREEWELNNLPEEDEEEEEDEE